jgi:hypothetical protein
MSGKWMLFLQWPKPEAIGMGVLSIERNGDAIFFRGEGKSGSDLAAKLSRTRIEVAAANGILLSGFEESGREPGGTAKYRHQEWWLAYPVESSPNV